MLQYVQEKSGGNIITWLHILNDLNNNLIRIVSRLKRKGKDLVSKKFCWSNVAFNLTFNK